MKCRDFSSFISCFVNGKFVENTPVKFHVEHLVMAAPFPHCKTVRLSCRLVF